MSKIKIDTTKKVLENTTSSYFVKYKKKIIFMLIFLVIVVTFPKIPYLNLLSSISSHYIASLLLWLVIFVLVGKKSILLLKIGIVSLVLLLLLTLMNQPALAEQLGNTTYLLLLTGTLLLIWETLQKKA